MEVDMEKGLIALAAALAIAIPALGTAWAQSRIGSAGAGTIGEGIPSWRFRTDLDYPLFIRRRPELGAGR